jgi:hypothetical protein
VIRLMGAEPAEEIGARLASIADDPVAGTTVRDGVRLLGEQFGRRRSPGVDLAVQALGTAMPEETIRAVATGYMQALIATYQQTPRLARLRLSKTTGPYSLPLSVAVLNQATLPGPDPTTRRRHLPGLDQASS